MENSKKVLEEWSDIISIYPRLDIKEAKVLYKSILNESNDKIRSEKREQLIKGTLYVVCDFIKKNNLAFFNNSQYDINDIISSCNEVWIEILDSGKLLKVDDSYGWMINSSFCSKLTNKLVSNQDEIATSVVCFISKFSDLFSKYLKLHENEKEVSYQEFLEFLKPEVPYYLFCDKERCAYTYKLFEEIVKYFLEEDLDVKITENRIKSLKYLFLNNAMENLKEGIDNVILDDMSGYIINNICKEDILSIIFDGNILSEREKDILKKRNGLEAFDCHFLEEIAKEDNVSSEYIRQIENRAIKKLQRTMKIRRYMEN